MKIYLITSIQLSFGKSSGGKIKLKLKDSRNNRSESMTNWPINKQKAKKHDLYIRRLF